MTDDDGRPIARLRSLGHRDRQSLRPLDLNPVVEWRTDPA